MSRLFLLFGWFVVGVCSLFSLWLLFYFLVVVVVGGGGVCVFRITSLYG